MQNLNIQLFLNQQCQLTAIDNTSYNNIGIDIIDHVSLEFLVYNDEDTPITSSIFYKKYKHSRDQYVHNTTNFTLNKDGIYTYYKFLIPKLRHLVKEDEDKCIAVVKDEIFYHNGNIYIGKNNVELESIGELDKVIENSCDIDEYLDIWNYIINRKATQTLSYQKIVLSYCKLQLCLTNLQKQIIFSSHTCSKCELDAETRYKRDFLLSALYVLEYLSHSNNYDEAQRIIDSMSSCNTLCGDPLDGDNDCGCGTVKY